MFRKVSVFILLSALLAISINAQDEPPEPDQGRGLNRVFSLAFGGGSYLGVEIADVNKSNYAELGLSEVRGVNVTKVVENSPADKAGLKTGDVIVRFDGQSVTSVKKLTRLISEVAPDHTVDLTVVRGGSEIGLAVTVGKRDMPGLSNGSFVFQMPPVPPTPPTALEAPAAPLAPTVPGAPKAPRVFSVPMPDVEGLVSGAMGRNFVWGLENRRKIGIGISSLSKQLGDYFGVKDGNGVLVTSVLEDSPAAKGGLRAGDVIVEAEGKPVSNFTDLARAINSKKEGDVTLTVVRDKKRRTFTVTPEKMDRDEMLFDGSEPAVAPKTRLRIEPRGSGAFVVGSGETVL